MTPLPGSTIRSVIRARWLIRWLTLMILASSARSTPAADQPAYLMGPQPAWVAKLPIPASDELPGRQVNLGEYFNLIDEQINVSREETFAHFAKIILNETGVQNGTQLKINFDPSYQKLTLHFIRVIRGTNVLDRLEPQKIKVIQQEENLERHIYNGALSILLLLEDVRVGDQIEYAYTIQGANPIFGGRFATTVETQWQVPMQRQVLRILWPKERKIAVDLHGQVQEPNVREAGALVQRTWTFDRVPPVQMEEQVPVWFNPFARIQFSEYGSWEEVANWALGIYRIPQSFSPEMSEKIRQWKLEPTPEKSLLDALQFVQDEVRYMGLEFGPFSHQPNDPSVVFARRFGDCKDKTLLLCAMLNAMDIEACPALVNTFTRQTINEQLPSPVAFDHVVVRAKLGGRTWWLDPTQSHQRGPLSARFFPNFGMCLLVKPGTTALTPIDTGRAGWPKLTMNERYSFDGYDQPVTLQVITIAEGVTADALRHVFATVSRETLEKQYLNYYAGEYAHIEGAKPLEMVDDTTKNVVQTVETYRIRDVWSPTEDKRRLQCSFYARPIGELLKKPATMVRKMPLGIGYPLHQFHEIELELPRAWSASNELRVVEGDFSRLRWQVIHNGKNIRLTYDYETLADSVPVEKVPAYLNTQQQMRALLNYSIFRANGPAIAAAGYQPNWSIISTALIYTVLLGGIWTWLYRRKSAPLEAPPLIGDPELTGLGGWLVLIGIGICLSPLLIGGSMIRTNSVFSLTTWTALTTPGGARYSAWWAPGLIFELLGNLTRFAWSVLLVFFFFQRRASFPKLYIALLVSNVLFLACDDILTQMIRPAGGKTDVPISGRVISYVIGAVLWSLYMLQSRRVKYTFVR